MARRTEALTLQPAGEQERGQDSGGKEDNSRQEAGDDERWRRWCNNQPVNEDVNNTPNPSAQHQHNNQPFERGGEAMATKRKSMLSVENDGGGGSNKEEEVMTTGCLSTTKN